MLLARMSDQMRRQFLETLERRIILEDLNAEEIRSAFVNEYLGETLREWVSKVEKKLDSLYTRTTDAVREGKEKFAQLSEMDREYSYEIEGRRKDICKKAHEPMTEYLSFFEKLQKHVDYLSLFNNSNLGQD